MMVSDDDGSMWCSKSVQDSQSCLAPGVEMAAETEKEGTVHDNQQYLLAAIAYARKLRDNINANNFQENSLKDGRAKHAWMGVSAAIDSIAFEEKGCREGNVNKAVRLLKAEMNEEKMMGDCDILERKAVAEHDCQIIEAALGGSIKIRQSGLQKYIQPLQESNSTSLIDGRRMNSRSVDAPIGRNVLKQIEVENVGTQQEERDKTNMNLFNKHTYNHSGKRNDFNGQKRGEQNYLNSESSRQTSEQVAGKAPCVDKSILPHQRFHSAPRQIVHSDTNGRASVGISKPFPSFKKRNHPPELNQLSGEGSRRSHAFSLPEDKNDWTEEKIGWKRARQEEYPKYQWESGNNNNKNFEKSRESSFKTAGGTSSSRANCPSQHDQNLTRPFRTPVPNDLTRRTNRGSETTRKTASGVKNNKEETGLSESARRILRLGDSEDGLPESLQGFDVEFVEKICSEVVSNRTKKVAFEDIAGCKETKRVIKENVLYPIVNPKLFQGILSPSKGILLFGPPGTGKTMLGQAIADNMSATFFSISATSLTSKWVGEGEKMVRIMFAVAKQAEPSVIFIDEIDSLLSARKSDGESEASRRMKNQFLVEMEGCGDVDEARLLIVGATNRPEEIDGAARRRLPKQIYVPLPDKEARSELLLSQLKKSSMGHTLNDIEIDALVQKSEGYSGSDLRHVCQEAAMLVLRKHFEDNKISDINLLSVESEDLRPISYSDVVHGLETHPKSVSESEVVRYEKYNHDFGTKG